MRPEAKPKPPRLRVPWDVRSAGIQISKSKRTFEQTRDYVDDQAIYKRYSFTPLGQQRLPAPRASYDL